MASLADVFSVLNGLRADGVIEEYAVGGAMAMVFWNACSRNTESDDPSKGR